MIQEVAPPARPGMMQPPEAEPALPQPVDDAAPPEALPAPPPSSAPDDAGQELAEVIHPAEMAQTAVTPVAPEPEDEPVVTVASLSGFRQLMWIWWGVVVLLLLGGAWAGLMPVGLSAVLVALALVPVVAPWPRPTQKKEPVPVPRKRRDARVEALVAALPEPALLLTAGGEIVTANARVALSMGQARAGDPLSFVVRVPEVLEAVQAAATDGLPRRVEFAERVPLDRWLEAHVVPLHLGGHSKKAASVPASAPDGVLLTFRDLTHQRRVEQMRADFVANASHELRTPLASLSGFIETLQGPARNDAVARERFLGIMSEQARRMSRLIDDLLSLSRIELHAHVQPETEVDLCDILNHVCDALSPLAQERDMQIEQVLEAKSLPVRGDRDELIRLLENLVENALKYGVGGDRVTVRLAREATENGAVAVASVRDYGPGIPPEYLPRLTERFYRVNVAASRGQGGTGLGLAIVKHIVARHRGRLNIESVPGEGATFAFRLDVLPDKKNSTFKSNS